MKYENLHNYLFNLLGQGELIFSKDSALKALGVTDAALRNSIKRQVAAKNIKRLMQGYYLIIPPEYQKMSSVPPELFINDLMKQLRIPYYVSLLSAASFHGATHQAVQIFQVMVKQPIKAISLERTRIQFYFNKKLEAIPTELLKTDRGPLTISTVEATALELVRYIQQSGNLNHVATVLAEIGEKIDKNLLVETAELFPLITIQRLGYLLEILDYQTLSKSLAQYLLIKKPLFYSPLSPGKVDFTAKKSKKWHLIINENVEPDL